MLKLTNSFYRYFSFTCEKFNDTHVRRLSHFNCKRKICSADCVDTYLTAYFHSSPQLSNQGHGKKRLRIKIPPLNSNECERHKPMSDPLQPTINHASYGGQFDVSADNDDPFEEFRAESGTSGGSNDDQRTPVQPIPADFRVWQTVAKCRDHRNGSTFKFKVLSYNVLAQYLLECHPYLYTECIPRNLKWKIRAARLYDEIIKLAPDILCLQEVQASHLNNFYAKFEQIGYYGLFKQKTGHRQDGCAIYFKQSLFELMDHVNVEFYQPDLPILNRDNIGMMVKLLPRGMASSPLVVATTHLLYNPKRTDVRLAQMKVFLAEIDRFAYYNNGTESGHLPIILTGDFNSTPDSAVVKLLDNGQVCASQLRDSSDWKQIGVTDNCQHLAVYLDMQAGRKTEFSGTKIYNSEYCPHGPNTCAQASPSTDRFSEMFNSDVIGYSLKLSSVYHKKKSDGRIEATTYQDYWVTVDYIYFSSSNSLRLVERLRLPTASECAVLGRLPNHVYGSDHLALAAAFELKPSLASSL